MPSMADIKALRERTGAGILDCKKALVESDDSVEGAIDWLRTKGIAKAAKKSSRAATEGLVHSYIHAGGKVGVMVEVNCETDFAAKNDQFKTLVHDIALHIAFAGPEYITSDEVDESKRAREHAVQLQIGMFDAHGCRCPRPRPRADQRATRRGSPAPTEERRRYRDEGAGRHHRAAERGQVDAL